MLNVHTDSLAFAEILENSHFFKIPRAMSRVNLKVLFILFLG